MSNLSQVLPRRASRPQLHLVVPSLACCAQPTLTHQRGLTAHDAPVVMGVHLHKFRLQLWREMTSEGSCAGIGADFMADDESPTNSLSALLEPLIAAVFTKRTGLRLRRVDVIHVHKGLPWMIAKVRWEVSNAAQMELFDSMTVGQDDVRSWDDGIPAPLVWSLTHLLAVTGAQAVNLAVMRGGNELNIHRLERSDAPIDLLVDAETEFWCGVLNGTPPQAGVGRAMPRNLELPFLESLHPTYEPNRT